MSDTDCVVAGAGVVGLAIARRLALAGREVLVLEAADHFGSETSSRNSEVIHAGIYYPIGSLKAQLCVAGRKALYAYAAERHVPHARTGKLIVATSEAQVARLGEISEKAARCGVDDLVLLTSAAAMEMEPALTCVAALHSPSTGIIDSHALMQSYLGDLDAAGGQVVFNTTIASGRLEDGSVRLVTRDRASGAGTEITTNLLVNAAGLHAQRLAGAIDGFPADHVPAATYAKGNYFAAPGRTPFERLIYPVPEDGGLGVHLTFDLGGQMRFGPDVEWIDGIDYGVDPERAAGFYAEIRRYWPDLPDDSLTPAYSGIRSKLSGPGQPAADFRIDGPQVHGVDAMVNLFGIESPGLTASLAIADHVTDCLGLPKQ